MFSHSGQNRVNSRFRRQIRNFFLPPRLNKWNVKILLFSFCVSHKKMCQNFRLVFDHYNSHNDDDNHDDVVDTCLIRPSCDTENKVARIRVTFFLSLIRCVVASEEAERVWERVWVCGCTYDWARETGSVCVCVCVCERERKRERKVGPRAEGIFFTPPRTEKRLESG